MNDNQHGNRLFDKVAAWGVTIALVVAVVLISRAQLTRSPTTADDPRFAHIFPYDQWPVWSVDGKRLLLVSNRDDLERMGSESLWSVNLDGSSLTHVLSRGGVAAPTWSANGKLLAFRNGQRVYVMEPESVRCFVITPSGQYASDPSWSPDGKQLALDISHGEGTDIYVADIDVNKTAVASHFRPVAAFLNGDERLPRWSPDGKWIAFVHTWEIFMEPVADEIWVMHPDGSDKRKICRLAHNNTVERMEWLPDSRRLIICQMYCGRPVVNVELSQEKPRYLPDNISFEDEERLMHSHGGGDEFAIARKYGGYYEAPPEGYLVYRYKFDSQGKPVLDTQLKIVDAVHREVKGFDLPYRPDGKKGWPIGASEVAPAPDGKRIAFYSNSSDYPRTNGTSIWVANLDGSNPVEITKPPQCPDSETPIVMGLEPGFPLILHRRIEAVLELQAEIACPSGWQRVRNMDIRLSRGKGKEILGGVRFDCTANVYRLLDRNIKPTGTPIQQGSNQRVAAGALEVRGEKCRLLRRSHDPYTGLVQASFSIRDGRCRGEWLVEVRAAGMSGKSSGWQPMGWISLK
ncbi:MAG TPA: hypothetical protein VHR86_07145 [Armatimonadota bacterium]|nr:hypothetical protein [Armatimonadota bacterium]